MHNIYNRKSRLLLEYIVGAHNNIEKGEANSVEKDTKVIRTNKKITWR